MNNPSAGASATHHSAEPQPGPAAPAAPADKPFDINPELTPAQRAVVDAVLAAHARAFATPAHPPAASPDVQHHIHLTDPQPVKSAPYRQSPLKQEVIREQIRKDLAAGIIAPSNSPWASPVSLVPKGPPDPVTGKTSWRMVIDYRRVNAKTRKDAYPVPLIEECLNACREADWISVIDIKDAYHHILMALESRGITAFVTADGLFEWKRMPFGLTNAPATFQRYVDQQLREFIGKFCAVFFDDCMVYTTGTLEQHMQDVSAVLTKLHSVGLEASGPKCRFAYKELLFVGHIVGKGTIKPDPDKIKAITDYPRPSNLTELKAFLGLANYYRRFIPGFATMANPLYTMLKKDAPFEWAQARVQAFEALKTALVSAPCLHAPNHRLPFILQTDASGVGISGVLSQNVDGEEHPVGYVSRQLNKAERNYTATEWECLAVVWSIGQFESFLIDKPFTIVTDHSALQWLATKRMENKRLTRWALTLQEYSYDIRHRPGKANANADALSRSPRPHTAPAEVTVGEERSTLVAGSRPAHFIRFACALHARLPPSAHIECRRGRVVRNVAPVRPAPPAIPHVGEVYELTHIDPVELNEAVAEQHRDPLLHTLISYVSRREFPAHMDAPDRAHLMRKAANFQLQDVGAEQEALFYYPAAPRRAAALLPPRLVVPQAYRRHILELFHSSPFGGHSGITRTLRKISARYFWDTLYPDVVTYLKNCQHCQTTKAERHVPQLPTGRIPDPSEPWEVVSMDFAGPLRDCDGFKHILLIVDHFTQYCVAIPTQNTAAPTVLRTLVNEVICRFGMPAHVLSDRGLNSAGFADLGKVLGYKVHMSAGRHPQGNGKAERFIGTLKATLTAALAERGTQWLEALAPAVFAINASPNTDTGLTPYFLNHGREPVFPGEGDLALARRIEHARTADATTEGYALALTAAIQWGLGQARRAIEAHTSRLLAHNETLSHVESYLVGDTVWLLETSADTRTGGVLHPTFAKRYRGPFCVMARVGPTAYIIRAYRKGQPTGVQMTVHYTRLRPYHGPDPRLAHASAPGGRASADPASFTEPARADRRPAEPDFFPPAPVVVIDEQPAAPAPPALAPDEPAAATAPRRYVSPPPAPRNDSPEPVADNIGASVHRRRSRGYRPNYSSTAGLPLPGDNYYAWHSRRPRK